MFKDNICGDQLEVPDDMLDSFDHFPPEFFVDPRCPPAPTTTKAISAKVDKSEAAKEPERSAPTSE